MRRIFLQYFDKYSGRPAKFSTESVLKISRFLNAKVIDLQPPMVQGQPAPTP
jgi:hypothetical protein